MKHKAFILIALGIALMALSWLAWPQPQANAQCGTAASSCKDCHEIQGQYPISNIGEWHIQHAFGDFCGHCHGGDMKAQDKATAHTGKASPLADVNASCAVCHPDDCDGRAEKYASLLGVQVGKSNGLISPRQQASPFLGVAPRLAGPSPAEVPGTSAQSPSAPPTPAPTTAGTSNRGNSIAAFLVVLLIAVGGSYVLLNERIVRFDARQIIAYIKKETWSPYIAGAVLGIVAILVVIISNALRNQEIILSASAPFESMFGGLAQLFVPDWVAKSVYFRGVMTPGLTWGVILLFGMALGGALSAISSGTWKIRWMPETQWAGAYGSSRAKRWILVFAGTIILEIGAGIAGGCTSGLAIWGGLQLAPAAFLFMVGMFASGILTALIVYRRKY